MYILLSDGGNRRDITYGSFKIYTDQGEVIAHRQMVFGYGTSNLAEYLSMIEGLKRALTMEIKDIIILTDSKLVQKQILNEWACNYEHLRVARDKARRLLKRFDSWKINKVTRNIVISQLGH